MTAATFSYWLTMAMSKVTADFSSPDKEWVLKSLQLARDRSELLTKDQFNLFFPEVEL